MGVISLPPRSNACPKTFRASPPCGLIWHVLQPSTAGLRNGSLLNFSRNSGRANAEMVESKKTTRTDTLLDSRSMENLHLKHVVELIRGQTYKSPKLQAKTF